MKPNALIAGSTGLVGSELLNLLVGIDYYAGIHLPLRSEVPQTSENVVSHLVNFLNLEQFDPGVPIRDVYICLGTTQKKAGGKAGFYKVDHDMVISLARWAASNKSVERLCVISSVGANPKSPSFYLRTKGQVEAEIRAMGLKHLCIIRPSLLLGKRKEFRLAEAIGAAIYPLVTFFMVGQFKKYRAVKATHVAEAMFRFTTTMQEKFLTVEGDRIGN